MRYYSTTAGEMVLQSAISGSDTMLTLDTTGGLPVTYPYTLILDYGTASEEVVDVTGAAGTTLTVERAKDGTIATGHDLGAKVRHGLTARDLRESREHEAATGAHGVAVVVGTGEAQTLRAKTFSPADDSTALTVLERAGNAAPVLAWKNAGGDTVAQWMANAAEWLDGTNVLARIRNGTGAAAETEILGLRLASTVRAIVGRKVAGATAKFIQLLDSDGTTELFSVGGDGVVASKGEAVTGNVTASGTVQGGTVKSTGAVTGASGAFSGNVSVGGALSGPTVSTLVSNDSSLSDRIGTLEGQTLNTRLTAAETKIGRMSYAEAGGQASVPISGSLAVTFPAGRFSVAPRVTLGVVANSMPASVVGVYHSTPTTSGFTIHVNSSAALGGGAATVDWHAVQMTSGSADG